MSQVLAGLIKQAIIKEKLYLLVRFLFGIYTAKSNKKSVLEPILAVIGQESGYTLDRSPDHHRDSHAYSHSLLRSILESPINLTYIFLGSGRKLEYLKRTHTYTLKTCKLHTERLLPGFELGTLLKKHVATKQVNGQNVIKSAEFLRSQDR